MLPKGLEMGFREETVAELRDVLLRNGFRRCYAPACNCGGWHHQHGLPERWQEVKNMLAEAGHPLCNENGNKVANALADLIRERDELENELENLRHEWGEAH
jgi:hypothetical protein